MIHVTQIVMISAVVLLLIYDIVAVITGGIPATISFQISVLSKRYRVIPFLLGALMGHFFWPVSG